MKMAYAQKIHHHGSKKVSQIAYFTWENHGHRSRFVSDLVGDPKGRLFILIVVCLLISIVECRPKKTVKFQASSNRL